MSKWNEYLNEHLRDPVVRSEWDDLEPEFAIIHAIIDARVNAGITQKQLSERTGIAQADISKMKNGDANPSLKTLKRLATAMNTTLKVEFIPTTDKQ